MSKRKALGKGLRSLIPEAPAKKAPVAIPPVPPQAAVRTNETGIREIDIDLISPNSKQPRTEFDETALKELAESLREQGLLQPIALRPTDDGRYELIAGERRWRASQMAGLLKIPAVVRQVKDERMLEYALIENIQRQELNPVEVARAFQMMMDDLDLTQQEIADKVGKPRSTVANALRLLNLQRGVQESVAAGQLSTGHAKALAAVTHGPLQKELAAEIINQDLNVRQAERLVAAKLRPATAKSAPAEKEADPNIQAAEERLQSAVGTKVRIIQKGEKGRIELHFFSHEEMERVYQILLDARR